MAFRTRRIFATSWLNDKISALMDILTPRERSERMRLVKSKGTGPERITRRVIKSLNYKCRSHLKTLPGSPDFVFPEKKKVIFVHGCFWHQHTACRKDHRARSPKSGQDYWRTKLINNQRRDIGNQKKLNRMGWRYLVVWECRLRNRANLAKLPERIKGFIESDAKRNSSEAWRS